MGGRLFVRLRASYAVVFSYPPAKTARVSDCARAPCVYARSPSATARRLGYIIASRPR